MLRIWDRPSLKRQNASLIKCRSYYFHLNFYYILVIRIKKLIVEEGKVKQKQKVSLKGMYIVLIRCFTLY